MTKHSELVKALVKPATEIHNEMTEYKLSLLHMAVGVCTEAGELLDAVKKFAFYNQELDYNNVIEELGDLEYYMEGFRQEVGIHREETLDSNISKLEKRYPSGAYTNTDAKNRQDKST